MGLRRGEGSRGKQQDSDERRHTLVDRPGVRESGMRLPSEMALDCALSVAASHAYRRLLDQTAHSDRNAATPATH
jgi:hypothetical protein